jgi:Phosphoinositide 3-kinase family, accessory domain (PIK domain)
LSRDALQQRLFELYIEETSTAFLELQLPHFGHPVLFSDNMYDSLKNHYIFPSGLLQKYQQSHSISTSTDALYAKIHALNNPSAPPLQLPGTAAKDGFLSGTTKFHDPLIMKNAPDFLKRSNPITQKYYVLTRDLDESGAKDLTPNADETETINTILNLPDFSNLSVEQKALLWHYRYSLTSNKRALVKFLQCVEWTKEKEEVEGMQMLKKWAEIDIEQALPLLSFMFCANNIYLAKGPAFGRQFARFNEIRAIAVKCLDKQSVEQINSIMLQLVQAYRYECFEASPLRKFLINRSVRNETLANTLHWHVKLEKKNDDNGEEMVG